jgi:hypothetical protein
MGVRFRFHPTVPLGLALLGWLGVLYSIGYAMGNSTVGAAISLAVGAIAALAGAVISLGLLRERLVRRVFAVLGLIANAAVAAFVLFYATLYRW